MNSHLLSSKDYPQRTSVTPLKRVTNDEAMNPRFGSHSIHDIPIHCSSNRFSDPVGNAVSVLGKVSRRNWQLNATSAHTQALDTQI